MLCMCLAGLFGFIKVKHYFIFSYVYLTVFGFVCLSKIWTQIWSVILSDSVHVFSNDLIVDVWTQNLCEYL